MNNMIISILKNSGEKEQFSKDKLMYSLIYAGASRDLAKELTDEIYNECDRETSTNQVYKKAFSRLKKISRSLACHYSIRKALLALGPDGYLFEKFVASLFRAQGYRVETNLKLRGKCVTHEVDVAAYKGHESHLCECKFHNRSGIKNDLKTALYIKARSDDLAANPANKMTQFWLISNTKFTKDAIEYANCVGLNLVGPSYPKDSSLMSWIKETRNHPITSLTTIKKNEVSRLLKHEIVHLDDVLQNKDLLDKIGLTKERVDKVLMEIKELKRIK